MFKLQGIVSEIPVRNYPVMKSEDKEVPTFGPVYGSNAIHIPVLKPLPNPKEPRKNKVKRLIIGAVAGVALCSFAVLGFVHLIGQGTTLDEDITWVQVQVTSGDTIWDLVQEANKSNHEYDTRELVYQVYSHNHINKKDGLQAGSIIEVPVLK